MAEISTNPRRQAVGRGGLATAGRYPPRLRSSPVRRRQVADPAPTLRPPPLFAPSQIEQREHSPHVVELAIAEVLKDAVEHHHHHVSDALVSTEVELFQSERGDRQDDPDQKGQQQEADEQNDKQIPDQKHDHNQYRT